jgi:hypothetical protein
MATSGVWKPEFYALFLPVCSSSSLGARHSKLSIFSPPHEESFVSQVMDDGNSVAMVARYSEKKRFAHLKFDAHNFYKFLHRCAAMKAWHGLCYTLYLDGHRFAPRSDLESMIASCFRSQRITYSQRRLGDDRGPSLSLTEAISSATAVSMVIPPVDMASSAMHPNAHL